MGRHRSPNSKRVVARELVYGVIAMALMFVLTFGWQSTRDTSEKEHANRNNCPAGNITIPYTLMGSASSISGIQEEFLATKPVFKDFCVTGFVAAPVNQAALIYTANNDLDTNGALERVGKSATSKEWPIVGFKDVGVAVPNELAKDPIYKSWTEMKQVAFINEQPLAGSIASSAMQEKPATTIARERAINEKLPFVTMSSEVPAGYTFVFPDQPSTLHLPTRMLAVNTSPAVTEEQSRAAVAFIDFSKDKVTKMEGPALESIRAALAAPPLPTEPAHRPQVNAAPLPPSDTLFLLDTSEKMAPSIAKVSHELSTRATKLGTRGHHVGMWNYSSPLSTTMKRGWRSNVPLSDDTAGANAAKAVTGFGTGGQPQTHEAIVAAMSYAQRVAFENNQQVKIILIATGTSDAGSQGPLDKALKDVDPGRVRLHVVHVGDDAPDHELDVLATVRGGIVAAPKTDNEREDILNQILGI